MIMGIISSSSSTHSSAAGRPARRRRPHLFGVTALALGIGFAGIAASPAVALQDAGGGTSQAQPTEDMPSAKQLIERHIKAVGGKEAIRKHKSRTTKARFEMTGMMGIEGDVVIYAMAPDRMLVVTEIPGIGEIRQGFDGEVAWGIDPMQGPRVLTGKELEQGRQQADFYSDLNYEKYFKEMETVGKTEFSGEETWEVKIKTSWDSDLTSYYSADTGLLRGNKVVQESPMGQIPTVTTLSEYKEFDGVKIPTKMVSKVMMGEQIITITEVTHGNVEANTFELPAEIKPLAEQQKKEDEAAKEKEKEKNDNGGAATGG